MSSGSYRSPKRGHLYLRIVPGMEQATRRDWSELKTLAGSGKAVGFGQYWVPNPNDPRGNHIICLKSPYMQRASLQHLTSTLFLYREVSLKWAKTTSPTSTESPRSFATRRLADCYASSSTIKARLTKDPFLRWTPGETFWRPVGTQSATWSSVVKKSFL
jgi:hypothetical protein